MNALLKFGKVRTSPGAGKECEYMSLLIIVFVLALNHALVREQYLASRPKAGFVFLVNLGVTLWSAERSIPNDDNTLTLRRHGYSVILCQ